MKLSDYSPYEKNDSFNKFMGISLAIHFALAFAMTLKNLMLPSEQIIIQNAIRVDMVALPDKVESVAPAPTAPEKPTPVIKNEPQKEKAMTKADPKKAQQDALNKLKQRDALEKLLKKQSAAAKESTSDAPAPRPTKNLNAGNQISQGDSVTGLERIAFDEYISQLKNVVNTNFSVPGWMTESTFKSTVEVVIDSGGQILKRTLVKPSGNSTFDSAALSAVDNSNPFPPAPERLTRGWGSFTIQFNFPDNF